MKTLLILVLSRIQHLQSVGGKFVEIDSLNNWKFFCIIFESRYFNKIVSWGRLKADIIIMFKMLFYSNWMIFSDFEFEKQCIKSNFWFSWANTRHYYSPIIQKIFITAKNRKYQDSCKANWIAFLKINKEMIQDATFIHSDLWNTKGI